MANPQLSKLQGQLNEAKKETRRLTPQCWDDRFASSSPSSVAWMEAFLGGLGMEGLENMFCNPTSENFGGGFEWDHLY
ncbi:hypothetical protein F511_00133 [Dorcoceras hygrometricum]|nr:hypothetical protein F511_00133 [Dorcoceras hygrometricum]